MAMLHAIAAALLERETLILEDIQQIIEANRPADQAPGEASPTSPA